MKFTRKREFYYIVVKVLKLSLCVIFPEKNGGAVITVLIVCEKHCERMSK